MTWLEILKHNGWEAIILIDQLFGLVVSTLLKEFGYADICLSANAWRWEQQGVRKWPRKLIDALFWFDPNHCMESYKNELRRLQMPLEMRLCEKCKKE